MLVLSSQCSVKLSHVLEMSLCLACHDDGDDDENNIEKIEKVNPVH